MRRVAAFIMAVMSREEARKIVDKLGRLKGYVSPENSAKLLESMPEVLESVENLREEVARLTKTYIPIGGHPLTES